MSILTLVSDGNSDGRLVGSFVYMLLCQQGGPIHVKIGLSDDPFKRLSALRNTCAVTPRRFAVTSVPSRLMAKRLEAALHKELSPWRKHGEWFEFTPEEKADFNRGWQVVFARQQRNMRGYPLKWEHLSVAEIVKAAEARKNASQRRWRERGPAFQDFLRHCKG